MLTYTSLPVISAAKLLSAAASDTDTWLGTEVHSFTMAANAASAMKETLCSMAFAKTVRSPEKTLTLSRLFWFLLKSVRTRVFIILTAKIKSYDNSNGAMIYFELTIAPTKKLPSGAEIAT